VSVLDGDRFEVIHRFASRYALHGGPKFTPDGRYVFFGSRDGWITKYDLWNLAVVAEVRAGLNMRNVAVSGDGRWVMAANYLPRTVVLFDADLKLVKRYDATTLDGKTASRVSAVYDAAPRQSFVVALKDIPEVWEISYDPKAAPIYDGLVHDYKMGEAIAKPGLPERAPHAAGRAAGRLLLRPELPPCAGRHAPQGGQQRRCVSPGGEPGRAPQDRRPADRRHAAPGLGHHLRLERHHGAGQPQPEGWRHRRDRHEDLEARSRPSPRPGPGFFMRSHENTRYAWTDSMMSPKAKDTLTLIDKATLEPVASLREPGRTLAHIEFTKDGRHALASVWEMDGAIIVYDAQTLKEVKRLPMSKPVGKYNVWNKITRSEGTSH
jgi:WD40 repeat protein